MLVGIDTALPTKAICHIDNFRLLISIRLTRESSRTLSSYTLRMVNNPGVTPSSRMRSIVSRLAR
jgi:hypothetical protein